MDQVEHFPGGITPVDAGAYGAELHTGKEVFDQLDRVIGEDGNHITLGHAKLLQGSGQLVGTLVHFCPGATVYAIDICDFVWVAGGITDDQITAQKHVIKFLNGFDTALVCSVYMKNRAVAGG